MITLATYFDRRPNFFCDSFFKYNAKITDRIIVFQSNGYEGSLKNDIKEKYNIEFEEAGFTPEAINSNKNIVIRVNIPYELRLAIEEVNNIYNDLQRNYNFNDKSNTLIVLDHDEILLGENVKEYIANSNQKLIRPTGTEILQHKEEVAINDFNNAFEQRNFMRYIIWMSKPIILKSGFVFIPGRHAPDNKGIDPDPNLFLMNLSKIDKDFVKNLYDQNASKYNINTGTWREPFGKGFRKEHIDGWYEKNLEGIVPIPKNIKKYLLGKG